MGPQWSAVFIGGFSLCVAVFLCTSQYASSSLLLPFFPSEENMKKIQRRVRILWAVSALHFLVCDAIQKTNGSIRTHSLSSDDFSITYHFRIQLKAVLLKLSFFPLDFYTTLSDELLLISFLSRGKSNFVWISVIYTDKYHQFSGFENHPVICWAEKTAGQSLYTDCHNTFLS